MPFTIPNLRNMQAYGFKYFVAGFSHNFFLPKTSTPGMRKCIVYETHYIKHKHTHIYL